MDQHYKNPFQEHSFNLEYKYDYYYFMERKRHSRRREKRFRIAAAFAEGRYSLHPGNQGKAGTAFRRAAATRF
jgi:hypothetical protein